ncbi:hypothetical protein H0H93_014556 [Arthromyces matolae]|nr:hypothetical protein H0H93_014556 [Arthromyces matolae]
MPEPVRGCRKTRGGPRISKSVSFVDHSDDDDDFSPTENAIFQPILRGMKRKTRSSDATGTSDATNDDLPPAKRAKTTRNEENPDTSRDADEKTAKSKKKQDTKHKVSLLQERWKCHVDEGSQHTYCYFTPTAHAQKHLQLTTKHLRIWAQALLNDDDGVATIETPPNHQLFFDLSADDQSAETFTEPRLTNTGTTPATSTTQVHPRLPTSTDTTFAPSTTSPLPLTAPISTDALVLSGKMGEDITIDAFGTTYKLHKSVLNRLKANGYHRSRTLRHLTLSQLHEIGFKIGDIASLKDALDEWSRVPKAPCISPTSFLLISPCNITTTVTSMDAEVNTREPKQITS